MAKNHKQHHKTNTIYMPGLFGFFQLVHPPRNVGVIIYLPHTTGEQRTLLLAQHECGILEGNDMRVEKTVAWQLNVFPGARWDSG